MNYDNEMNTKQTEKAYYAQTQSGVCGATAPAPSTYYGDACTQGNLGGRPYTMREQAEKNIGYHRIEADKADRAAAFFRGNPAFDEFIQLIRQGAIQI